MRQPTSMQQTSMQQTSMQPTLMQTSMQPTSIKTKHTPTLLNDDDDDDDDDDFMTFVMNVAVGPALCREEGILQRDCPNATVARMQVCHKKCKDDDFHSDGCRDTKPYSKVALSCQQIIAFQDMGYSTDSCSDVSDRKMKELEEEHNAKLDVHRLALNRPFSGNQKPAKKGEQPIAIQAYKEREKSINQMMQVINASAAKRDRINAEYNTCRKKEKHKGKIAQSAMSWAITTIVPQIMHTWFGDEVAEEEETETETESETAL